MITVRDGMVIALNQFRINPTMRLLAKLTLNTLWGPLAVKDHKAKSEYVRQQKRLIVYSSPVNTTSSTSMY